MLASKCPGNGFIRETQDTRELKEKEMKLNREIAYLEEKSARLGTIEKFKQEIEELNAIDNIYNRLAYLPLVKLNRNLRELKERPVYQQRIILELKIEAEVMELKEIRIRKRAFF